MRSYPTASLLAQRGIGTPEERTKRLRGGLNMFYVWVTMDTGVGVTTDLLTHHNLTHSDACSRQRARRDQSHERPPFVSPEHSGLAAAEQHLDRRLQSSSTGCRTVTVRALQALFRAATDSDGSRVVYPRTTCRVVHRRGLQRRWLVTRIACAAAIARGGCLRLVSTRVPPSAPSVCARLVHAHARFICALKGLPVALSARCLRTARASWIR